MKHSERNLYEYEGSIVELSPTFVYEVVINKYWKNGFCQLDSKLYKAERLLHIKKDCTITKFPEYRIEKEISLIGVPQEFIVEQNLSKYIKKSKKK